VSTTEATVIKEPVVETKTVEMLVTHEELVIERRAAVTNTIDKRAAAETEGIVESRTEINVPLKREEVLVTKEPFVKEDLVVKKKPVTETRTITEELRSEKVTVRDPDGKDLEESE
jgi:uncharacterized protein (TIGR02271 family)